MTPNYWKNSFELQLTKPMNVKSNFYSMPANLQLFWVGGRPASQVEELKNKAKSVQFKLKLQV